MKLFIYPNLTAQRYFEKVLNVLKKLQDFNYEIVLDKEDCLRIFNHDEYSKIDIKDCDLILSLGGDGTFLRASKLAYEYDLPICGINCGNLGYLCTYKYDELDKIDFEKLNINTYQLIESEIDGNKYLSVNDVIIGKDYFGGTIKLKVSLNDKELYIYRGDGIIIASSLGSTAYNKSAGGLVLNRGENALALTPICPVDEDVKGIKVNDEIIEIELLDDLYDASIFIDGEIIDKLKHITIKKSDKHIRIME